LFGQQEPYGSARIGRSVRGFRGGGGTYVSSGRKADGGDELRAKSPLSQLDEVDVCERTRLEEQDIASVQALAWHDLIDRILSASGHAAGQTRVKTAPPRRIAKPRVTNSPVMWLLRRALGDPHGILPARCL